MPDSASVSRRTLVSSTLVLVGAGFVLREPSQAKPPEGAVRLAPRTPATTMAQRAKAPPKVVTVDRVALTGRLDAHRTLRGGTMGLVVHDLRNGASYSWRAFTNESLSTIKVLILVACLKKCQDTGVEFTATQRTRAARMIQSSDNAATDSLLAWVGTPNVQRAAGLLGMTNTVVRGGSAGGWWGYSTTTAADLVLVLDALAKGTTVINAAHRAYIRSLMSGVVSDQRWGVADPPLPSSAYTETKNGWGPLAGGYRLNSMGRVTGAGRDYTMAILTRSPQGFRYGKKTINGLATIVHEALVRPL